jgi:peptidoglycan/xylan/chitin deacetylase (PgdA/CDA1 family)
MDDIGRKEDFRKAHRDDIDGRENVKWVLWFYLDKRVQFSHFHCMKLITSVILGFVTLSGIGAGYMYSQNYQKQQKPTQISISKPDENSISKTGNIPSQVPVNIEKNSKKSYTNTDPNKHQLDIPVLTYHHIDPVPADQKNNAIAKGLRVSPEGFDAQMKKLKEKGYKTLHIDEYTAITNGDKPMPEKAVLITIDDGFIDNYAVAFPTMKKYGLVGNFAIITNVLGTGEYMTKENVQEMHKNGMGIMSHTTLHCALAVKQNNSGVISYLPNIASETVEPCPGFTSPGPLTLGQVEYELGQSKKDLEKLIGAEVDSIVYPFGNYNKSTVELGKKVGYKFGFTTKSTLSPFSKETELFELPRISMQGQEDAIIRGFFATI